MLLLCITSFLASQMQQFVCKLHYSACAGCSRFLQYCHGFAAAAAWELILYKCRYLLYSNYLHAGGRKLTAVASELPSVCCSLISSLGGLCKRHCCSLNDKAVRVDGTCLLPSSCSVFRLTGGYVFGNAARRWVHSRGRLPLFPTNQAHQPLGQPGNRRLPLGSVPT